jgi:Zn-dependent protease
VLAARLLAGNSMNSHISLGRIAGIPIYLDMMFVLVLILFSYPYFTSNDPQAMSAGLVIIAGLVLSILLHELGHAFAGRLFKAGVSHIELTGLGGIAHFERSLPISIFARSVIYLAGPLVNLLLWLAFQELVVPSFQADHAMLGLALSALATANLYLLIFNLFPAYPLDGGHTLDAWLGGLFGNTWAVRIVASLGILIALWLGFTAFPNNFWRLLLAFFLFQTNAQALKAVGGWQG